MKKINYTGSSKLIARIVAILNEKVPLPLDGQGDADWGSSGQVLTTDGQGGTSWQDAGGGGDVTDVEVNGTSVVNAQGVAEVSVPTATSDLNNDSGFIDGTDLSTALSDYTPTSSLATVATSGDYDDLTNKPTIPAAQVQSDWSQADNTQVDYIKNKPSIPTVGDGTITIQKNGTTVDTFTTNQSANKTVNITVTEGHTIWNRIKTALTSRAALWFADASVSDASADGATKVEVIKHVDAQGWNDATEDGVYDVDDGGNYVPITGNEIAYDANTSINEKIDELADSIDYLGDAQLQRSVTIATSAVGGKYYAVLGHLPIVYPAMPTINRVNVLGVGDATITDFTVAALDANGNYYMSTTSSSYGGKALWVEMSI